MDGFNYYHGGYYNPYAYPHQGPYNYMDKPSSSNSPLNTSQSLISSQEKASESTTSTCMSLNQDTEKATSNSLVSKSKKNKKANDKFSNDEQKMLVSLWAEKHYEIESKDNRKVWDVIVTKINNKFKLTRTTEKYKQKMKYLIERYKITKNWNPKQSGGHTRESPFYKEINEVLGCRDIITIDHVIDVGNPSSSSTAEL